MLKEFVGKWASILPEVDTVNSNDTLTLSADGALYLDKIDESTGAVEGFYQKNQSRPVPLTGYIRYVGSSSYAFVLRHGSEGGVFTYEGSLVAKNVGPPKPHYIVAGGWRLNNPTPQVSASDPVSASDLNGQQEGTWVATKP